MPDDTEAKLGDFEYLKDPAWWIKRCCNDLYFLCRTILQTLEDPTPGYKDLYSPTHKRICDFTQRYAKAGQKILILTPRGWVKSYIITVGWSIQRLLRNFISGVREHEIISNATIANSREFLEKIKYNLRYNDILQGLFREFLPKDPEKDTEKWTQDEIGLHGCRIETGSVEGNLVSRHYGVIINDDLVNLENSQTRERIAKVIEWWQLAQSLLNPKGIEILIGTRWDYDDLYGHILEKHLCPPKDWFRGKPIAEFHNGYYHILQMDCWGDPENEKDSTFPTLFPDEELKRRFEEQGDRAYGQYRNDPISKGKSAFKKEWFRRYREHEVDPIRHTIMLIDPSGKAKDTESSYTGIVNINLCPNKKGYVDFGERRLITDLALAEYIVDKAIEKKPDTIGIEDTKYKVIFEMLEILISQKIRMEEIHKDDIEYAKTIPYILVELSPKGRPKEVRIRHLTSWFESGNFLLPYNGTEELEDELIRFPTAKKNDIIDALAYVLDVMVFPSKKDAPKYLVVPKRLKMTQEERIEEEWDNIEEEVGHDQPQLSFTDDLDLY